MRSRYFEQNTLEERIEIFRDYFDRDVESGYASSVACCDGCFDDFAKEWPGTVARDINLQLGAIDIGTFLGNSRIQDAFYPEEIDKFSEYLTCPNCGEILKGFFWIYEHPFSLPEEYNVRRISKLANQSPFLLLSDPFAKRVFETIAQVADTTAPQNLPRPLYRARRMPKDHRAVALDFGPPPATKVREGRYNHAGHPMFYVAEAEATALAEMGRGSESLHVGSLDFNLKARILDLRIQDDAQSATQEVIQCLARSALCAAPRVSEGWDRPEYVFSRFVADCARHAGFAAIRYGSVKDHTGANIVIFNAESEFALLGVSYIERR